MLVTLTTDFGTADSYVGQMKGVLLAGAPGISIVDVTHEIPPFDILAGALVLQEIVPWFPRRSLHIAIVDPGVGTSRERIVVETVQCVLLGPNNGLLSLAAPTGVAYRIDVERFLRPGACPTFEGRDVFAYTAARLAGGAAPHEVGPKVEMMVIQPPEADEEGGVVLRRDRFGNLVTSLRAEHVKGARALKVGELEAPFARTYGDVEEGEPIAYVGSSGLVEIGLREGSAAARVRAARGMRVEALR